MFRRCLFSLDCSFNITSTFLFSLFDMAFSGNDIMDRLAYTPLFISVFLLWWFSKCDLIVHFIKLTAINPSLSSQTHTPTHTLHTHICTHSQPLLIYQVWLVTASRLVLDLQPQNALPLYVCVIEDVFVSCSDIGKRKEVVKRGNEM